MRLRCGAGSGSWKRCPHGSERCSSGCAPGSRGSCRLRRDADRFGLIHADLVPENILVDACRTAHHRFRRRRLRLAHVRHRDLALLHPARRHFTRSRATPSSAAIGVIGRSTKSTQLLPMFLAARGTTYLGWVHTRRGERGPRAHAATHRARCRRGHGLPELNAAGRSAHALFRKRTAASRRGSHDHPAAISMIRESEPMERGGRFCK